MGGDRIKGLKTAMLGLSGADTSISGRFARFRNRERIFLLPFNHSFGALQRFDMGDSAKDNQATLAKLSARVGELSADGGTAIFSATQQAYQEAAARRRAEPARFYSIVVMTDGANNNGISAEQFASWYNQLPAGDKGIKVFPVLFGEANPGELQRLAELTGGRAFDSRKNGLQAIFKEIRGYQ
jgi:Ca-activated chloride channel family protein